MGDITRLIGEDGYVAIGELGTELEGDSSSDFDTLVGGGTGSGKGFYQLTAFTTASTYIDWSEPEVTDYFYDDGTGIMNTGDKARALPTTALDSIKTFEIALSKTKIDVTTLVDKLMTYRMGKADAVGSMTGVTIVAEEILSDRFLDRMEVDNAGARTMNRRTDLPVYFVGYLQGEELSGETLVAIVGKVELENYTYGASLGSAQEFNTGFAPTAGDKLQKINVAIA
jgi:hypothetical protein